MELHYLRGWRLAEIADHLGRGKSAVAGLLTAASINSGVLAIPQTETG